MMMTWKKPKTHILGIFFHTSFYCSDPKLYSWEVNDVYYNNLLNALIL